MARVSSCIGAGSNSAVSERFGTAKWRQADPGTLLQAFGPLPRGFGVILEGKPLVSASNFENYPYEYKNQ